MKLLHFADLHLDTTFRWAPPDVARRRRQALRQTLTRIADLAQEVEPDAILCGGDLYEQDRFSPDTSEFLRTTFERLHPIPIFIAPGNHDWFSAKSFYAQVEWPPNVHLFTGPDLTAVELADGVTLWGAAFMAPTKPRSFLDGFSVDRDGINLALFHGSERSGLHFGAKGKSPHAPFDGEEIETVSFA